MGFGHWAAYLQGPHLPGPSRPKALQAPSGQKPSNCLRLNAATPTEALPSEPGTVRMWRTQMITRHGQVVLVSSMSTGSSGDRQTFCSTLTNRLGQLMQVHKHLPTQGRNQMPRQVFNLKGSTAPAITFPTWRKQRQGSLYACRGVAHKAVHLHRLHASRAYIAHIHRLTRLQSTANHQHSHNFQWRRAASMVNMLRQSRRQCLFLFAYVTWAVSGTVCC